MRLLIFTPALKLSAVGRVARLVVGALCEAGHTVTVVRTELSDNCPSEIWDFGVEVLSWKAEADVRSLIAEADAVVYQIGDNFLYHAGGVYWLERQRGIVCLHDFFLGHLFYGWAQTNSRRAEAVLRQLYGDSVARTFFGHASSPHFIDATHRVAPMTEWIATLASAVISHSGWGMGRVLSACPGPVRVVPLAYQAPPINVPSPAAFLRANRRMRLLTVGHVNPNKRTECVIRVLGSDERLRDGVTYTLAGAVQPEMRHRLEEMAVATGVDLHICGEVSEVELGWLLSAADVVCCLRNPTLEAASASTIEAMLVGRAVIVEDHGFYSELPDGCVCKIRPSHEEEDLRDWLLELVASPDKRKRLGERAEAWARRRFTAENYAAQLVGVVASGQRSMLVSDMMQAFARQLWQWGGAESTLALPETLVPLRIFDESGGKCNASAG